MKCEEIGSQTPLYLSGELEGEVRLDFEGHVAGCSDCRRELQGQRQMDARIREAVLAEAVDAAAVEARTLRQIHARPAWVRWAVAAAVLLAVGGTWFVYRPAPPRSPDIYIAALRDHHREIIDQQPRPWVADRAQVEDLASKQGVSAPVLAQLAPEGYQLEHGKICRLNGRAYLHLVYQNQKGEVSLFLHGNEGMGAPIRAELRDGKFFYATGMGDEHLASVQAGTLSVVYVSGDAGEADRFADRAAAVL